jgi:hypothetical protein
VAVDSGKQQNAWTSSTTKKKSRSTYVGTYKKNGHTSSCIPTLTHSNSPISSKKSKSGMILHTMTLSVKLSFPSLLNNVPFSNDYFFRVDENTFH